MVVRNNDYIKDMDHCHLSDRKTHELMSTEEDQECLLEDVNAFTKCESQKFNRAENGNFKKNQHA